MAKYRATRTDTAEINGSVFELVEGEELDAKDFDKDKRIAADQARVLLEAGSIEEI